MLIRVFKWNKIWNILQSDVDENNKVQTFYINTSNTTGTSAAYVNGTAVINNGAAVGDIYFTVPDTAPATLYYNCQYHSSMAGTINISSAMVIDKANGKVGINETSPSATSHMSTIPHNVLYKTPVYIFALLSSKDKIIPPMPKWPVLEEKISCPV